MVLDCFKFMSQNNVFVYLKNKLIPKKMFHVKNRIFLEKQTKNKNKKTKNLDIYLFILFYVSDIRTSVEK